MMTKAWMPWNVVNKKIDPRDVVDDSWVSSLVFFSSYFFIANTHIFIGTNSNYLQQ